MTASEYMTRTNLLAKRSDAERPSSMAFARLRCASCNAALEVLVNVSGGGAYVALGCVACDKFSVYEGIGR